MPDFIILSLLLLKLNYYYNIVFSFCSFNIRTAIYCQSQWAEIVRSDIFYHLAFTKTIEGMASVHYCSIHSSTTWRPSKDLGWKRYFYMFLPQISQLYCFTKNEGTNNSHINRKSLPKTVNIDDHYVYYYYLGFECIPFYHIIIRSKAIVKTASHMYCI